MFERLFPLLLFVHHSSAVIYRLNGTEYERMPLLNYLDNYDDCFNDPNPYYCTVELRLVPNTTSDLYNLIQNYSEWHITHYDHRVLNRGVCMTRTCKKSKLEIVSDLNQTLVECMNDALRKDYQLEVKIFSPPQCYSKDDNIEIEFADVLVAVLCGSIIMVNIIATMYDLYGTKKLDNKVFDIFLSFSITRNRKRLSNPEYRVKPTVKRLRGFDGARAITMLLLIAGHSMLFYVSAIANPHRFEQMYDNMVYHIFLNGAIIVQLYFLMSGVLLGYNMQRTAERDEMRWTLIMKNIFKRWLRLTPTFAVLLAVISTLMKFTSSGPLWQRVIKAEIDDCRRYWFWNIFYLSNYKNGSQCMPQTWYLAADMHLYSFGIALLVLVKSTYWRKVVLALSFFIGMLIPGLVTYLYDFTAMVMVSPNVLKYIFLNDASFDYLYKPTHNNISTFVLGLSSGLLIYQLQKNNFDLEKYKKFKLLYWALIPGCFGVMFLCSIFYVDGADYPMYFRVIFQIFLRPVAGALYAVITFGMVFKMENPYRRVLEWDGWSWIAKVSYSAYLIHLTIVRITYGSMKQLYSLSLAIIVPVIGITTLSFIVAVILWLLIEAPVSQIVKICLESPPKPEKKRSEKVEE